jgi:hypothetical protein
MTVLITHRTAERARAVRSDKFTISGSKVTDFHAVSRAYGPRGIGLLSFSPRTFQKFV